MIIKKHENKTYPMIVMAGPTDKNVSAKEFDKLSKYKDLQTEIERILKLKALRLVIKNVKGFSEKLPANLHYKR